MTADNGLATVALTKRTVDDKDYYFALTIRAYRSKQAYAHMHINTW